MRLAQVHFSSEVHAILQDEMKVKYFQDTDTLLVDFSDRKVVETHDLNETVLVELDDAGRVVSMTIEHARQQTDVAEFSYQLAGIEQEPDVLAVRDRPSRKHRNR